MRLLCVVDSEMHFGFIYLMFVCVTLVCSVMVGRSLDCMFDCIVCCLSLSLIMILMFNILSYLYRFSIFFSGFVDFETKTETGSPKIQYSHSLCEVDTFGENFKKNQ